ncbi:MAG: hypothetical protein V1837_01390 [Candidatus Woesearchaeota archaeon]
MERRTVLKAALGLVAQHLLVGHVQAKPSRSYQRAALMDQIWEIAYKKKQLVRDCKAQGSHNRLYGVSLSAPDKTNFLLELEYLSISKGKERTDQLFELQVRKPDHGYRRFDYELSLVDDQKIFKKYSEFLATYDFAPINTGAYSVFADDKEVFDGRIYLATPSHFDGCKTILPEYVFKGGKSLGHIPQATVQRVIDYADQNLNAVAALLGISDRVQNVPKLSRQDIEESRAPKGTATRIVLESLLHQ